MGSESSLTQSCGSERLTADFLAQSPKTQRKSKSQANLLLLAEPQLSQSTLVNQRRPSIDNDEHNPHTEQLGRVQAREKLRKNVSFAAVGLAPLS